VAARQLLLLVCATIGLWVFSHPLIWIPLAFVQGFTVFNFTVLLHEVVHETVFPTRRPRLYRLLSWCYAIPSGLSATQFTRWHLDHHAELGSDCTDPKRFHLSPKRNERWVKLLYFTPALFPIYFRGAAAEARAYPAETQRTIRRERVAAIGFHLLCAVLSILLGGWAVWLRVQVVPIFFVFPIAFIVNRLGQHYDIEPNDPAKWSTLVKGSWFWDSVYLNSNYHLEHHYFPRVPFYNLPRLQRLLWPFYETIGLRPRGYGELLWHYLVSNRRPHTNWHASSPAATQPEIRTAS